MTSQAVARLAKELKEGVKNPVGGFKLELVDDENLFEWLIHIEGPEGTPYEGGIFKVEMKFPDDYPNSPPTMKFLSPFWHPNVYDDGNVCISILHTPDPMSGEEESECWRPIQTVESILVSVVSMLSDPNFSSPANIDASKQLREHPDAYNRKCKDLSEQSRKLLPADFEIPKPKPPEPELNIADDIWDDYGDDFDFDEDDFLDDDDDEDDEDDDEEYDEEYEDEDGEEEGDEDEDEDIEDVTGQEDDA